MKFRTEVPILESKFKLDHNSQVVCVGSCFATNIAKKLSYFKFQNICNPFGILFQPPAIEKLLDSSLNSLAFTEEDIFFHQERWHSFAAHSHLSDMSKYDLLANLNATVKSTKKYLQQATHVIITYGTSWVYRDKSTNLLVANCHKMPQHNFVKEILSVDVISNSVQNSLEILHKLNPDVKVIFTVSPVRHIKDGFVENQLSKSHLIAAVQHIVSNSSFDLSYFPAYEIMMDELRDYRFYAEDMLHPNTTAIDYIWQRFVDTTVSSESLALMKEIDSIQKSLQHIPFNPDSERHKQFLIKLQDKKRHILEIFPKIQF